MSLNEEYDSKDREYYRQVRTEILDKIPLGTKRMLEIGCAEGVMAQVAKGKFGMDEVVGVEYNEQSASVASNRLDKVICGNVETIELPFPENYFDVIICGDVLEHLIDPWETLKKLVIHLRIGGVVIVSIPNIAYWDVVRSIMRDEFTYQDSGILDRTHLRFFTRSTIIALLHHAGLEVINEHRNTDVHRGQLWWRILTFGYHKNADVVQFVFTAQKKIA
ncbi:MAG: class I SAM-dependent methyltransferase [Ignavibacteria bacterium]|nr:class I SAM-dependent methyltransferase [Ignavibacteria bacterium]